MQAEDLRLNVRTFFRLIAMRERLERAIAWRVKIAFGYSRREPLRLVAPWYRLANSIFPTRD